MGKKCLMSRSPLSISHSVPINRVQMLNFCTFSGLPNWMVQSISFSLFFYIYICNEDTYLFVDSSKHTKDTSPSPRKKIIENNTIYYERGKNASIFKKRACRSIWVMKYRQNMICYLVLPLLFAKNFVSKHSLLFFVSFG